ncbi:TolB family protein [Laceyella putida]|uniref:TolB family protein n=1 Tax=Laceyella putida TaxID=110101 RepID=A0ABW2RQC1_9BACL
MKKHSLALSLLAGATLFFGATAEAAPVHQPKPTSVKKLEQDWRKQARTKKLKINRLPAAKRGEEKILFHESLESNLYVVNPDGTDPHLLIEGAEGGKLSPDGKKILFTAYNGTDSTDVYVANSDGTHVVNLTHSPEWESAGSWNPDGTKVTYDSFMNDDRDIWEMNADGTNKKNLTQTPGFWESYGNYSPDGKKILFIASSDGYFDVYTMNADGSNVINVTNTPGYYDSSAEWTQDGRISLNDERNVFIVDANKTNPHLKACFDADYAGNTELSSALCDQVTFFKDGALISATTWSPDEKKLAVSRSVWDSNDQEIPNKVRVFLVSPGGDETEAKQVTNKIFSYASDWGVMR